MFFFFGRGYPRARHLVQLVHVESAGWYAYVLCEHRRADAEARLGLSFQARQAMETTCPRGLLRIAVPGSVYCPSPTDRRYLYLTDLAIYLSKPSLGPGHDRPPCPGQGRGSKTKRRRPQERSQEPWGSRVTLKRAITGKEGGWYMGTLHVRPSRSLPTYP